MRLAARRLALVFTLAALAGCGAQPRLIAPAKPLFRGHALTRGTIVDLPGVAIGVQQKLVGKYQTYKLTGTGTIVALTAEKLEVTAKVVAKVAFITQTKDVTFALGRAGEAYDFVAVNKTDHETYAHKATLVSAENGRTTFKLDDGSTALLAADGKGAARIVYGDFDLTMGGTARGPLVGPTVDNAPSTEHFFD